MDNWLNVKVPGLPPLPVEPRLGGRALPRAVSLYVCGITPYDATHLGHAQTYLTFDYVVRLVRASGRTLRYVQNVTDVDDPLLERATEIGVDWRDLAREEIALYFADMEALRVVPPDHYVGVVESIPLVVDAVTRLLAVGAAYPVRTPETPGGAGAGDVYGSVAADALFWEELPIPARDALGVFAERGGDPARPGKRAALDPLLWRAERATEPAWDGGPLGAGRPGWHIECAAIAEHWLGGVPTITGGGSDLSFPHHHMSASHLRQLGHPEPGMTMHVGMVGLDGHKMSKSLGNLVLVSRLRAAGADPRAIRLALAAHHYAAEWEWDDGQLVAAQRRLGHWLAAARIAGSSPRIPGGTPGSSAAGGLATLVATALAADLDTPAALDAVDRWADAVLARPEGDPGTVDPSAVDAVDALLGIDLRADPPAPDTRLANQVLSLPRR